MCTDRFDLWRRRSLFRCSLDVGQNGAEVLLVLGDCGRGDPALGVHDRVGQGGPFGTALNAATGQLVDIDICPGEIARQIVHFQLDPFCGRI